MKAIALFALALAQFNLIEGSYYSNCEIKGLRNYDWSGYTTGSIKDTHEGLITTFETENVVEILSYKTTYMHATFENNKLSIFTNERFKKFEEEYESNYWYNAEIKIDIKFNCSDNRTDTLSLETEIIDVNTHDPVFSKDVYEYHFGMSIPEDYDFTQILPISASDIDFTNDYVYFTINEYSDDFILGYETGGYYQDEDYSTSFKALKEIRAPFRKELVIVSRDAGKPSRNSTARVVVSLTSNDADENESNESNESEEGSIETGTHPPVFAKHLYFANYTLHHDLQMEEKITIKYGAEDDTTIQQSGYDEYFKITLDTKMEGVVDVTILQSLPQTILESTSFLVIEIEAVNEDLHIPGRTALIIYLPINEETSDNCGAIEVISSNNTLSLVFFLTALLMIAVMNVVVLIWFFQKKKLMVDAAPTPYRVEPIRDIPRMEKIPL